MTPENREKLLPLLTGVIAVFLCVEAAQAFDDFQKCSLANSPVFWQLLGGQELTGSRHLYKGREYIQPITGIVQEDFLFKPGCDLALEYVKIQFTGDCRVSLATNSYYRVSEGVDVYTRSNAQVLNCQSRGHSTNVCSRRVRVLRTGSVDLSRTSFRRSKIALIQVTVQIRQRPRSNLQCSLVYRMVQGTQSKPTIEIIAEGTAIGHTSPLAVAATTAGSSDHRTSMAETAPPGDSSSPTGGIIGGVIAAVCAVLVLVAFLLWSLRLKGKSPFCLHTIRRLHRSSIARTPGQEAAGDQCAAPTTSNSASQAEIAPFQPYVYAIPRGATLASGHGQATTARADGDHAAFASAEGLPIEDDERQSCYGLAQAPEHEMLRRRKSSKNPNVYQFSRDGMGVQDEQEETSFAAPLQQPSMTHRTEARHTPPPPPPSEGEEDPPINSSFVANSPQAALSDGGPVAPCPGQSPIYVNREYDNPRQLHAPVGPTRYVNVSMRDNDSNEVYYDSTSQLPPESTGQLNLNSPRQDVIPLYASPRFHGDTMLDSDDARPMTGPAVECSDYLVPNDL